MLIRKKKIERMWKKLRKVRMILHFLLSRNLDILSSLIQKVEIKLVNMTLLIDGKPTDPSIVYAKQKDLVRYRVSKVTKQLYFIT